jgi:hypothetical protein
MLGRLLAVLACTTLLISASLPRIGPVPEAKPDVTADKPVEQTAPVPEPRPPAPEPTTQQDEQAPPVEEKHSPVENATDGKGHPLAEPLSIEPETDEEHAACTRELQAIGAVFKDIPRIDDGEGCGIDKPISLTEVLPGIKFKPEGTMRCEPALALARWMKNSVIPAGDVALKKAGPIVTVNQASTYVCRLRNNATQGKISEHARGNAVDIASFTFQDGTSVEVQPRREDSTLAGAFQRAVSAAGCLYFTTVLDPESDAAHEHHFHMDVLKRDGDFRYCH